LVLTESAYTASLLPAFLRLQHSCAPRAVGGLLTRWKGYVFH